MFAYIKFIEGPYKGLKIQVPVSRVQYKFKGKDFDAKKKYRVQHKDGNYYNAQIIFLEDSVSDLTAVVQRKRPRLTPLSQLETASSADSSSENSKLQQSKSLLNFDQKKKEKLKRYATILNMKENELEKALTPDNSAASNIDISTSNKQKDTMNRGTKKDENTCVQQETSTTTEILSVLHENVETTEDVTKNMTSMSSANKAFNSKPIVISNEEVHSIRECKVSIEKLKKIIADYEKENKKYKELKKDNEKLKKKIITLKTEITETKTTVEQYQKLNRELQAIIIEKADEKKTMKDQLQGIEEGIDMDYKKNFLPIGKKRETDNTVHIGRNVWIPENNYNHILNKAGNPSKCAGSIILSVFGEHVLLSSTRTGRESNRKKHSKMENDNAAADASEQKSVQQLDSIKLQACFDFYMHWLKHTFTPIAPKGFNLLREIHCFNDYVSKKIAYLKKPCQTKTKPKKKSQSECSDSEQITLEVDVHCEQDCNTNDHEKVIDEKINAKNNVDEGEKNILDQSGRNSIEYADTQLNVEELDNDDFSSVQSLESLSEMEELIDTDPLID